MMAASGRRAAAQHGRHAMKMMRMTKAALAITALGIFLQGPVDAGGLDPGLDFFGVYFDRAGNTIETFAPLFTPYHAYLLVMYPSAPIDAFECVVTRVGDSHFVLAQDLGAGAVDTDATADGFRVTRPTPYPVQYGAALLVDWTWMQTNAWGMWVYIGPGTEPLLPGGLPALGNGGVWRQGYIASGSDGFPVACVNARCTSADEPTSFGALKALYR